MSSTKSIKVMDDEYEARLWREAESLRHLAFLSVSIAVTACVIGIVAVPMLYSYTQKVQGLVDVETEYCRSATGTLWKQYAKTTDGHHQHRVSEVLRGSLDEEIKRRSQRQAGYGVSGGGAAAPASAPVHSSSGIESSGAVSSQPVHVSSPAPQGGCEPHMAIQNTPRPGPPGPNGPPGQDGQPGQDGHPGSAGQPGSDAVSEHGKPACEQTCEPAPAGPAGGPGPKGPPGQPGAPGAPAPPSHGSPNGPPGPPGPPGQNGQPGGKGQPGPAGEVHQAPAQNGPPGPPGLPGGNGQPGADGHPGNAGGVGPPGPPGDAGGPGDAGKNGENGGKGADGERGGKGACDHCPPPRMSPGY